MRIAITPGEPSGIGPDLVLSQAAHAHDAELVAVADPELLAERAAQLGLDIELQVSGLSDDARPHVPGKLKVLPVPLNQTVHAGKLDPANADYVLQTLRIAIQGCLNHQFDALVTGPVQKSVINDAGHAFSGHTEFIANLTGGHPVMMLAAPGLRVALTTTHLPLSEVSRKITRQRLMDVIHVLHHDLRERFGFERPRILVCGLNPHAGEQGHLGREEIDTIIPALDVLRAEGIALNGPLPADTLFTPDNLSTADAVLAMYHDQGLPVLKHMGFGKAINITLGLPIIRTSVDHGTALDLAASGKADTGSLQAALQLAIQLAHNQTDTSR